MAARVVAWLFVLVEPSRTDHHADAPFRAGLEERARRFGRREIDRHLGVLERCRQHRSEGHPERLGQTGEHTGILAERSVARAIDGGHERGGLVLGEHAHDVATHASSRTMHCNARHTSPNSDSALRMRASEASPGLTIGKRISLVISPRIAIAAFTGPGLVSMNMAS